ncbi:hypothetical protein [Shewanella kaireitica]|uniref:hypothetical protein n=1 Tax=Shewanella kaireitica TaxID=212021 RepID=UPI00200DD761|nr:hypothetical protein [Shewanella kaireitica]MCL1092903.1 hypothetical protein [Shewanella kaireitica]
MPININETADKFAVKQNGFELTDLLEMQTEFALIKSASQSKMLTAMLCIGVAFFSAFGLFLLHMAPS